MKLNSYSCFFLILFLLSGCTKNDLILTNDSLSVSMQASGSGTVKTSKNLIGDPADVSKTTTGGICLMGGGTDVDAAFRWMITNSGGGDFVVIRADNSLGYNSYIYNFGGLNSVETIVMGKATDAQNATNIAKIKAAEALFIAGGDQANYVRLWKDTPVEEAINYLINTKKVPVGGTSAGCAILGSSYFSALNGTVTSDQAMSDPYNSLITLGHNDFIIIPILANTITDQHFSQRGREGRLVTFMARMNKDLSTNSKGIGVDEQTAVCIDATGIAQVYGNNNAFFLKSSSKPEICTSGIPLTWNTNSKAISVYKIKGSSTGAGGFDLKIFGGGSGGESFYYNVTNGILSMN